jgi:hypothetical protein
MIACLLVYFSVKPIYSLLTQTGFISSIVETYMDFKSSLNLAELFESFVHIFTSFYHIVMDNMTTLWIYFVLLGVTLILINPYLVNLASMPISNSLHYYMGSMTKHGFFLSFSDVVKKNMFVQLIYYLVTMPFNILILLIFLFSLKLFSISFAWSLFAVLIITVLMSLILAFRNILFVSWIPTIVVQNYGVWKSLRKSIKGVFRKFGKAFINMFYLILTIIFINVSVAVFTLTIGLIITIPASYVVYNCFGMSLVYETQGMRYYIDTYSVVTPRKKEISDKLVEMKYIV